MLDTFLSMSFQWQIKISLSSTMVHFATAEIPVEKNTNHKEACVQPANKDFLMQLLHKVLTLKKLNPMPNLKSLGYTPFSYSHMYSYDVH